MPASPFDFAAAAARYHAMRPYIHPQVITRVQAYLGLTQPLPVALDVAAGTGQSARALRAIAAQVFALDVARAMLEAVPPLEGVQRVQAPAEHLPFAAASIPLITVVKAYHWLDQARFLDEVRRVLHPGAYLVVYTHGFTGVMRGGADFQAAYTALLNARYPALKGSPRYPSAAQVQAHGLKIVHSESYRSDVSFNLTELVRYLGSHSQIIRAAEGVGRDFDDVAAELAVALKAFFPTDPEARAAFVFEGRAIIVQKLDA